MSFISPEYVIFFSLVLPVFFRLEHRYRWPFLLAASYFFYAYGNVEYLPLIIFTSVFDYFAARAIAASDSERMRKLCLAASISVNLCVLFVFKYSDFFNATLSAALDALGLTYQPRRMHWTLPIGISFYTFQSMTYTIDVYRRKLKPEKHLGIVATYVAFFPQLVAGPIERATNLLPQFREKKEFNAERMISGLQQILWGAFKKAVIADTLAIYVNAVYNNVHAYSGLPLVMATIFFAFQIYCDFSGYSDIAIGTARVLGFTLMENFRQPYFSASVREFWTRWHISLSTWFRDYLYIPLGGNRVSFLRHLVNLMVVFAVCGLWHGAAWTFVVWGMLHGISMVIETVFRHRGWQLFPNQAIFRAFRILLTFVFTCTTWIFFRANSFNDALYVINHFLVINQNIYVTQPFAGGLLSPSQSFSIALGLISFLLLVDACIARWNIAGALGRTPLTVRWLIYYGLGAAIVLSGVFGTTTQQFIYFKF